MLSGRSASLAAVMSAAAYLAMSGYASADAASPPPGPIVVGADNNGGVVHTTVTAPGSPDGKTQAVVSDGSSTRCTYNFPGTDGQVFQEDRNGVPGRYYYVDCYRGAVEVTHTLTWFPDSVAPVAAPVLVTPGTLAQRAVDQLGLPTPRPQHNPARMDSRPQTIVGIETWWWVDPGSFRPITHTVRAGPVWATVTATPVATYWQSGSADADDVRCAGPGTPYDMFRPVESQHSDCVTVYRRSSARQPQTGPSPNDRYFTAAVTVTWRVTWVGTGGASGVLPALSRTARFPIAVAEVQTVNE